MNFVVVKGFFFLIIQICTLTVWSQCILPPIPPGINTIEGSSNRQINGLISESTIDTVFQVYKGSERLSPENALNIVFLSEGYTNNQLGKYASDVNSCVSYMFQNFVMFNDYKRFFNVWRIAIPSPVSGIGGGLNKAARIGNSYDTHFNQRLPIVGDTASMFADIDTFINWDVTKKNTLIIVLCNERKYGGGMFMYFQDNRPRYAIITSDHGPYPGSSGWYLMEELFVHETAHLLVLSDEYTESSSCQYFQNLWGGSIPEGPNVSKNTGKWGHWDTVGSNGYFLGANHCNGFYRSSQHSFMRTIYDNRPFNDVSKEWIVKEISQRTTAIIDTGMSQGVFSVELLNPLSHALKVQWFENGALQKSGSDTFYQPLSPSSHVEALVIDSSSFIMLESYIDTERVSFQPSVTLPVKYRYIEAIIENQTVRVSWSTWLEINNQGFEIQFSNDGKKFENAGLVSGNGNSRQVVDYSFSFSCKERAVEFLRLKQIDSEGVENVSQIVIPKGN